MGSKGQVYTLYRAYKQTAGAGIKIIFRNHAFTMIFFQLNILQLWKGKDKIISGGATMKVADLTTDEFKELIGKTIEEKFRELIDPDLGLELREKLRGSGLEK
ncbi:MAG: hypothetical protein WA277_00555 [Nitrospirota bacterium]